GHGVGALADFRSPGVNDHAAIAINFDIHRRMRHVRANDRIRCAAHVVTAGDAEPTRLGQIAFAIFPAGVVYDLLNALRKAVTLHAQAVHGDARWLEQIPLADLRRIDFQLCCNLIELRFKSEANIHGSVAAHRAAGWLIGKHAIALILNIGNVVQRAEQRAGVKNRNYPIRAVSAAVLNHASLHRGNASIVFDASLEIDDRPRPAAVSPENFFTRISDLDRGFGFAGRNRSDDLQWNDFALATEPAAYQRFDHANL